MNNKELLTELITFLKDNKEKELVKTYAENFKIEDLESKLSNLFEGEKNET